MEITGTEYFELLARLQPAANGIPFHQAGNQAVKVGAHRVVEALSLPASSCVSTRATSVHLLGALQP
jgi:hypothetical protein